MWFLLDAFVEHELDVDVAVLLAVVCSVLDELILIRTRCVSSSLLSSFIIMPKESMNKLYALLNKHPLVAIAVIIYNYNFIIDTIPHTSSYVLNREKDTNR